MQPGLPSVLLLTGVLLSACHRPAPKPPTVAIVGTERILAPDLASELERIRIESEAEIKLNGESLAAVRKTVLEDLVNRRLLLAEAARAGITVSDKEVEDALAQRQALSAGEVPKDGLTPNQLRDRTREQLVVDRFLLREVAARVAVGPTEAEDYYKAHPEEFRRSEQVRVSQIVLFRKGSADTSTLAQAKALRSELNRGTDFGKLARQHSAAPEARIGGDLGWFGPGMMPTEIADACFKLKKGQISDVVETPYGIHIFKLVDRRDAANTSFAEAEPGIQQRLQRAAVQKAEIGYLEKLRAKTPVQIFENEVAKVM